MNKEKLLEILIDEFRKKGFEGVSLSSLSEVTGLGKSSLYHYFPKGKTQMILEILETINNWINKELMIIPEKTISKEQKIVQILDKLGEFYCYGENNCILDVLSINIDSEEINIELKNILSKLKELFKKTAFEFGYKNHEAEEKAYLTISLLEGALIITRILNDKQVFLKQMDYIKNEIFVIK